jgi:hypothetical protein
MERIRSVQECNLTEKEVVLILIVDKGNQCFQGEGGDETKLLIVINKGGIVAIGEYNRGVKVKIGIVAIYPSRIT